MFRKMFSIFTLFILPIVVLITPLVARSNPVDLEKVAHMKAGHQKVEGVVSEVKSGLYSVKISTGAMITLTEAAAVREGHRATKVGNELTFWVNEGNRGLFIQTVAQPNVIEGLAGGSAHAIYRTNDSSSKAFLPRWASGLFVPPSTM
jgi:hypothetical protein